MHNPNTRNQFIALRAQGWSLAHIAAQIHVHKRTLVVWNREMKAEIHTRRALEVEALQEKLLASYEIELTRLGGKLAAVEQELKKRDFSSESTITLLNMAARLRDQIRKIRIEPNFDLYPDPAPDFPEPPPELHHFPSAPPALPVAPAPPAPCPSTLAPGPSSPPVPHSSLCTLPAALPENTTITPPKPHQFLDSFFYRLLDGPRPKPNPVLPTRYSPR